MKNKSELEQMESMREIIAAIRTPELVQACEMDAGTINHFKTGKTKNLTMVNFQKISAYLKKLAQQINTKIGY